MRSQIAGLDYMQGQPMSQYYSAQQQPRVYQELLPSSVEQAHQEAYPNVAHSAAFEAAFAQAEGAYTSREKETQSDLSNVGEVAGVRLDPIFNNQSSDFNRSQPTTVEPPDQGPVQHFPEQGDPPMRIGSDSISYNGHETARTAEQNSRDADELARTAGRLLNSMAGETSSKFEQSQFLSLMRKIRDGQVVVRGDEFHEMDQSADTTRNDLSENVTRSWASSVLDPPGGVQAGWQDGALTDYRNEVPVLEEKNKRQDFKAGGETDELRSEETRSGEAWGLKSEGEMARAQEDVQALHPGGRGYPVREGQRSGEQEDRHKYDHWASGGLGIEDDERIVESHGLAGRFSKVTVQDGASS